MHEKFIKPYEVHSVPSTSQDIHVIETCIDRTCGSAYDLWLDTILPPHGVALLEIRTQR